MSPSLPSPRQLWLLALVLFVPLLLTIWLMLANTPETIALVTVGAVLAAFIVIFCCIRWRQSVEATPERLTVRHSLYTFSLARSEVTAVSVQELASLPPARSERQPGSRRQHPAVVSHPITHQYIPCAQSDPFYR